MTEEARIQSQILPDLVPSPEGGPGLLLDAGPEVVEEQSTASDQDAPAASGATSAEDNFGTLMAQEAPPLDLEPSVRLDMNPDLERLPGLCGRPRGMERYECKPYLGPQEIYFASMEKAQASEAEC